MLLLVTLLVFQHALTRLTSANYIFYGYCAPLKKLIRQSDSLSLAIKFLRQVPGL
jgi:hypothetical protein